MEKIELTIEEVARLTGKSKEEIIAATQAEDGSALEPKDISTKITGMLSDKFNRIKQDAAAQSLRNGLEKREKELAKKFGIDSYNDWDDLSSQIAEKSQSEGTDTENAKQVEALKAKNKEYAEALKTAKAETEKLKSDYEYQSVYSNVRSAAMSHVEKFAMEQNLNLPSDPIAKKAALEKIIDLELKGKKFKSENGKMLMLDDSGMPITDENLNPLAVENLAEKTILSFYSPMSNTTNNTSNFPTPNGSGAGGFKFSKEDLTPARYVEKATELKRMGNKEALDAFTKQYYEQNK